MSTSIFDKKSPSFSFYERLFTALSINEILYQTGQCRLLKDMNEIEYKEYQKHVVAQATDVKKAS